MTEQELAVIGATPCAYQFGEGRSLRVEHRGGNWWAIVDGGMNMRHGGGWEHEPLPSSRGDDFLERCRFDLDTALRTAHSFLTTGKMP